MSKAPFRIEQKVDGLSIHGKNMNWLKEFGAKYNRHERAWLIENLNVTPDTIYKRYEEILQTEKERRRAIQSDEMKDRHARKRKQREELDDPAQQKFRKENFEEFASRPEVVDIWPFKRLSPLTARSTDLFKSDGPDSRCFRCGSFTFRKPILGNLTGCPGCGSTCD